MPDHMHHTFSAGACRALRNGGWSIAEIADDLQCTEARVLNALADPADWHAAALELWKDGRPDREIAAAVGLSKHTVSSWRNASGLPVNRLKRPRRSDGCADDIYDMNRRGLSDEQIARRLGLSRSEVGRCRRSLGLDSMQILYSDETHARMQELYAAGMDDGDIARECGVSRANVWYWRKRRSLSANASAGGKTLYGEETYALVRRLYEQGLGDSEIAKKCGLAYCTVRRWRTGNALPANRRRGGQPLPDAVEQERRGLYEQGLSDTEIARRTHYTRDAIRWWRTQRGLPANGKRSGAPSQSQATWVGRHNGSTDS